MQTVLFGETIFGPVKSRRLGVSLGVNLSPRDGKICSFDCLYCEAGFNAQGPGTTGLPPAVDVLARLEERLASMKQNGEPLDVITFSGNGEPTLHPEFATIVDGVIALRDKYFPSVKISVLSNSTMLDRPDVVGALRRVDNNILKLDSAINATMRTIDRPGSASFSAEQVIGLLSQFHGEAIIQTMILRGEHDGISIDNSTPAEIEALIDAYRRIAPRSVMIYSIDRKTPAERLQRVKKAELQQIAQKINAATGIEVTIA